MLKSTGKMMLLYVISGCFVIWAWNSPLFWLFYDHQSLYAPVFFRPFDPYTKGSTVEGTLYERFSTQHVLSLVFDRGLDALHEDDLKGKFRLVFSTSGRVFQEEGIIIGESGISVVNQGGAECWLKCFDLPFPNADEPIHFKLTVIEPVVFPKGIQPPACCMVNVTYHL